MLNWKYVKNNNFKNKKDKNKKLLILHHSSGSVAKNAHQGLWIFISPVSALTSALIFIF